MMSKENAIFAVVVGLIVSFFLSMLAHMVNNRETEIRGLKEQAIELEYARHNPKTGDWEWIEK